MLPRNSNRIAGNDLTEEWGQSTPPLLERKSASVPSTRRLISREIDERFIEQIIERLAGSRRIRRRIEPWGRISIDRQLPFLTIYRKREEIHRPGDEKLVMGEAAYLAASGERKDLKGLRSLVGSLAESLADKFGAFLIVEVWITHYRTTGEMAAVPPTFRIFPPVGTSPRPDVDRLARSLQKLKIQKQPSRVEIVEEVGSQPPGLQPLITPSQAKRDNIYILGLEVSDVYRDSDTEVEFPRLRQKIWRSLANSLKQLFFQFTSDHTTYRPINHKALGKRSLVNAVWEIDSQLAQISQSYDLVLTVTPTNTKAAFEQFKRRSFQCEPQFLYRPLAFELADMKRQLFSINIDKVEDPALAQLFFSQQRELDNQITLLADRGTSKFLYGSIQLYGRPSLQHIEIARHILNTVPLRSKDECAGDMVKAPELAQAAEEEMSYYRSICPDFDARVEVRDDIAGVMVSEGNLLISKHSSVARRRLFSLLQHEIGTHVLTYFNGSSQKFRQLQNGFVGYEELQEGLAVLAEYLSGGLTRSRLRMLAARVIAAHMMCDGASFVETYRELVDRYRFTRIIAFKLTMRIFRGGGFTKDAIYLRGLLWLLEYFSAGGDLNLLLVGKFPHAQIPLIEELMDRKVVQPPLLIPRYLQRPVCKELLNEMLSGITIDNVCERVVKG